MCVFPNPPKNQHFNCITIKFILFAGNLCLIRWSWWSNMVYHDHSWSCEAVRMCRLNTGTKIKSKIELSLFYSPFHKFVSFCYVRYTCTMVHVVYVYNGTRCVRVHWYSIVYVYFTLVLIVCTCTVHWYSLCTCTVHWYTLWIGQYKSSLPCVVVELMRDVSKTTFLLVHPL